MNNSNKRTKGQRNQSKSKDKSNNRKNAASKPRRSSSKKALKYLKKQDKEINKKTEPNAKRLKRESEGKKLNADINSQVKETMGKTPKSPLNPKINNNCILIENTKDICANNQVLKKKRNRPLKRKLLKEKSSDMDIDDEDNEDYDINEKGSSPKYEQQEGQYTLRKRRSDERIDFNLINCHQCHQIGMLNQMLTCRNERCRDSYCFNCIQKFYIKNASRLNLLTMGLSSWKCYKCKGECKCDLCIKLKEHKSIEIPQPQVIISLDSKPKRKKKTIRRRNLFPSKRLKVIMIPKEKQNIITVNDFTIIEIKDRKLKTINSNLIGDSTINEDSFKTIEVNGIKPYVNLKKRERLLMKVAEKCEKRNDNIDNSNTKQLKGKCLLCASNIIQANELLAFANINDLFAYMNYLFTFKTSLIAYNDDIFQQNAQEIAKYSIKSLDKEHWEFDNQAICKGCLIIRLNQPKCLKYLFNKINHTKKRLNKPCQTSITNMNDSVLFNDLSKGSQSNQKPTLRLFNNGNKGNDNHKEKDYTNTKASNRDISMSIPMQMPITLIDNESINTQFNNDNIEGEYDCPFLSDDEQFYYIKRKDVNVFIDYNEVFNNLLLNFNQLVLQLYNDMQSDNLGFNKVTEYSARVNQLYQSYQSICHSYSMNQSTLMNKATSLIECLSSNYPSMKEMNGKISEIKNHFGNITIQFINLLRYIDNSFQWFIAKLTAHYQVLMMNQSNKEIKPIEVNNTNNGDNNNNNNNNGNAN